MLQDAWRRHRRVVILALALGLPASAQDSNSTPGPTSTTQEQGTGTTPVNSDFGSNKPSYLHRFLHDEYRMWTSPFRPSNYDSHTAKKYALPFALISGALIATDTHTASILSNSDQQTKWSGRVSQLGSVYSLAGISGGSYLLGRIGGNDHLKETGLLGLEALVHTQIIIQGLKLATQRERPLDHDGDGSFWEGGNSFPSGHAAGSFALAAVFAYEYRDHIAVPITAYSLASLVSLSRLSAQRHWASDVFVGGSVGFLIGRFVYKHHHDPNLPGSPVSRTARLMPDIVYANRSFGLFWAF